MFRRSNDLIIPSLTECKAEFEKKPCCLLQSYFFRKSNSAARNNHIAGQKYQGLGAVRHIAL